MTQLKSVTHLHDAISHYHDLCQSSALAQDSWAMLQPEMKRRDLFFGERPLCTVLRPLFHDGFSRHYLNSRTSIILGVFRKLSHAFLNDSILRRQLHLDPNEEFLASLPTGFNTTIPTARLDSFFTRRPKGDFTLHFIEFNGESPAGMAYSDLLADLFLESPLLQAFSKRYHLEPITSRRDATDALLSAYYQWRGNHGKLPDIAIVDWDGVPTTSEFRLFAAYFARYGIKTIICTPDELEFKGGELYAAGQLVDFVFKRVLTSELLQEYGLQHPLVDAVRANAICMVNPFNCKLLHKKASFAVASDERNAHLFNPLEREAIRAHIPWTRLVEDRRTEAPNGAPVDLLDFASRRKDHLVLKPNDEYGGKGVLIGWETEQEAWETALNNGLDEPSIIQARATIAYEDFPSMNEKGAVEVTRRLVDCDPFLFHGYMVGGNLTRLSTATLLNVTAGGGSVTPSFIIDPK